MSSAVFHCRCDDLQPMLWGLLGEAECCMWLGESYAETMVYLNEALTLLTERNISRADRIRTHGLVARLALRERELQRAKQGAEEVLRLSSQTRFRIAYSFEGYSAPAEIFLSIWEREEDSQAGLRTYSWEQAVA